MARNLPAPKLNHQAPTMCKCVFPTGGNHSWFVWEKRKFIIGAWGLVWGEHSYRFVFVALLWILRKLALFSLLSLRLLLWSVCILLAYHWPFFVSWLWTSFGHRNHPGDWRLVTQMSPHSRGCCLSWRHLVSALCCPGACGRRRRRGEPLVSFLDYSDVKNKSPNFEYGYPPLYGLFLS